MIEVDSENINSLLRLGLIQINMVYPIRKDAHFRVEKPIKIKLSDGSSIVIDRNFEFDGSSSPRFLWWLFPSYGDFFFASLIHDYLYTYRIKSQKFSDKEMLIWSNILNKNKIDNYFRYLAVRLMGKKIYLTK